MSFFVEGVVRSVRSGAGEEGAVFGGVREGHVDVLSVVYVLRLVGINHRYIVGPGNC
jgi:hypothetical protein